VNSALYEGWVRHVRHAAPATGNVAHEFRYRSTQVLLFLDEVDAVTALSPWWSARHPAPVWFRRNDFGGDRAKSLDESVRDEIVTTQGVRPTGRIALLGNIRTWGFLFNPLTTYYVYNEAGDAIDFVVLEVRSTPWLERRRYVLRGDDPAPRFTKTLHVSPFLGMDHDYVCRWSPPGKTLGMHLENWHGEVKVFDASLTLKRVEMSPSTMQSLVWRRPFTTYGVTYGIYREALTLLRKRAPFFSHPSKAAKKGIDRG